MVKTLRKGILQHHTSIRSGSRALSSGRSNTSGHIGSAGMLTESFRVGPVSPRESRQQPSVSIAKDKPILTAESDTIDTSGIDVHLPAPMPVNESTLSESKDQIEPVYESNATNTAADKGRIDNVLSSSSSPNVYTVPNTYTKDDPLPRPLQYSLKEPSDTQSTPLVPVPAPCSPNVLSPLPPLTTYASNCTTSGSGLVSPIDMNSPKPSRSHREPATTPHIPIHRNKSVGTDYHSSTTIDIDKYSTHINEVRRNSVVLGQISIQQDDVAVIPRLDAKNDRNIVSWVCISI